MIPIGVTAQFDIEGDIVPISFILKGVQYDATPHKVVTQYKLEEKE